MLTKEAVMEIRLLARQGLSIRGIARELGISRNTVRYYLRGGLERTPGRRRPGRPRKLEPYESWLRRRVEGAAPIRLPAAVLHREIKAMGFEGSVRTVQRFVSGLYPEPAPEPVVRFETAPGHQAQMDWGEYRLCGQRIYAFIGVLCYSRWLYLEYVDSTRAAVLVACHRRMFSAFGGVPREVLYDNMRTVVTQRDAYGRGRHRFHDGIWALAAECAYRPRLCRPYRPQTKGKVERSVHYVAHSFFYPLLTRCELEGTVLDLARLNAEARLWCARVANVREHGTTRARPVDRLDEERQALQAYVAPAQGPDAMTSWPRYPLQRSPREYDAILQEVRP